MADIGVLVEQKRHHIPPGLEEQAQKVVAKDDDGYLDYAEDRDRGHHKLHAESDELVLDVRPQAYAVVVQKIVGPSVEVVHEAEEDQ